MLNCSTTLEKFQLFKYCGNLRRLRNFRLQGLIQVSCRNGPADLLVYFLGNSLALIPQMVAVYDWNGNVFGFAIGVIVQESYLTASLHIDERH